MKILNYINEKENNNFENLKISSVVYNEQTNLATLRFVYNQEELIDSDKQKIYAHVNAYFKNAFSIETKFKKYFIDSDVIIIAIIDYIKNNFSNIAKELTRDNIVIKKSDNIYHATITCDTLIYNYFESNNITVKLNNHLKNTMFNEIIVQIKESKSLVTANILESKSQELLEKYESQDTARETIKFIPKDVKDLIGKIENKKAYLPIGLNFSAENITIGGEINYFAHNTYLSKRKDTNGKQQERDYFTFDIKYDTHSVRAVYFPRNADVEKAHLLENGKKVLVNGELEYEQSRPSLRAKNIAFSRIPEIEIVPEVVLDKQVASEYKLIYPEPFESVEQQFLFAEKKQISKLLQENTFIVFDLETTGIDASKDEITEIGAVKIVDGEIVETFATLIKPKQSIPEFITKITGISNDMVKTAPSIEEVLPDFYKFCHQSTLVAYNINFDYRFINHIGSKNGYKFNHKQIDAMYLARVGIPGLKRFTLKDATARLGIELTNAHRAVFDAVATAKLFLELSEFVDK